MKDEDLDELVADGVLADYEYIDNPIDELTLVFPNGKKLRIEAIVDPPVPVNLMVNLT